MYCPRAGHTVPAKALSDWDTAPFRLIKQYVEKVWNIQTARPCPVQFVRSQGKENHGSLWTHFQCMQQEKRNEDVPQHNCAALVSLRRTFDVIYEKLLFTCRIRALNLSNNRMNLAKNDNLPTATKSLPRAFFLFGFP